MMIDRYYSIFMVVIMSLVVIVVGASQYQQFALNENNAVKLGLINDALHNQTEDILNQLVDHRQATSATLETVRENLFYINDSNRILHHLIMMKNICGGGQ